MHSPLSSAHLLSRIGLAPHRKFARGGRSALVALTCLILGSAPVSADKKPKVKYEEPGWTPQYENQNPDMKDEQQADGTPGSDGLPDGWSTEGGAVNTPAGSETTKIPAGGSVSQLV